MLNYFRRSTNSLWIKVFVGFVILAMAWGIGSINRNQNINIVNFKYCEPITRNELLHAIKDRQKFVLQFNPEISELQIKYIIIQNIIQERLLQSLASDLGLSFTTSALVDYVRNQEYLQNDNQQFDKNKFQKLLNNLNLSEENYFAKVDKFLARAVIENVFNSSNYQAETLIDRVSSFLAEERTVSIISADKNTIKLDKTNINKDELEDFFSKKAENFRVPEKRDINYLVLNTDFFIANKLLKNNKDTSGIQALLIEHEKLLEECVASGMLIDEIAKKFNLKLQSVKGIDMNQALKNKDLADLASQAFNLQRGETSYPFVLNNNTIMLLNTQMVYESFVPNLQDVLDKVKAEFLQIAMAQKAKDLLKQIHTELTPDNFNTMAKNPNIKLQKDLVISKKTAPKIPLELAELIFQAEKNSITPVFMSEDAGYIALVQNIRVNKNDKKNLDIDNILNRIHSGYLQEVMSYLYQLNDVKINYEDPIFKE
jgi:hypothetical protein